MANMRPAALTANRYSGWVIAKYDGTSRPISPDLVNQPTLQDKKGIKIESTQQVCGQGPARSVDIAIVGSVSHR
jgi:hypothetical protein